MTGEMAWLAKKIQPPHHHLISSLDWRVQTCLQVDEFCEWTRRHPGGKALLRTPLQFHPKVNRACRASSIQTINELSFIELVRDRKRLEEALRCAGVPVPSTVVEGAPNGYVVKPLLSYEHQFSRSDSPDVAEGFCAQPWVKNSGEDTKVYVVGEKVWTFLRPSNYSHEVVDKAAISREIEPNQPVLEIAEKIRLLGGRVFGFDVIWTERGAPVVVDVNSFPGLSRVDGAMEALRALVNEWAS